MTEGKVKKEGNELHVTPGDQRNELPEEDVAVAKHRGHIAMGPQYVKDLSFESPFAPASVVKLKKKPVIDLDVDAIARQIQGDTHEVQLHIIVKAKIEKDTIFLCDLTYNGLFTLLEVPKQDKEAALLVHGCNILYPFARRVIADLTRDGGFPALVLEPIDFAQVFAHKQKVESAKASEEGKPQAKKPAPKKKPARKKAAKKSA